MSRLRKIAVIGGDGIGPEVIAPCVDVLEWYRTQRGLPLELWHLDLGAERYLREGVALPLELRNRIANECSAVLLGAIGDARVPDSAHAREIVLGMRQGFDLYANIRPVRALGDALVPLKGRSAGDVDLVVVRENSEGAYAGFGGQLRRGTSEELAIDEDVSTRRGVERLIRRRIRARASAAPNSRAPCGQVERPAQRARALAPHVSGGCRAVPGDPGRSGVRRRALLPAAARPRAVTR